MVTLKGQILLAKSDNKWEVESNPELEEYCFIYALGKDDGLILHDNINNQTIEIPIKEATFLIEMLMGRIRNKLDKK